MLPVPSLSQTIIARCNLKGMLEKVSSESSSSALRLRGSFVIAIHVTLCLKSEKYHSFPKFERIFQIMHNYPDAFFDDIFVTSHILVS